MPIFNTRITEVDKKECRRYAGLRKAENFPEELIDEACDTGLLLAQPRGIWTIYDYDSDSHTIMAEPPYTIEGDSIIKHLNGCTKVALLAVTVGEDIEDAVTENFKKGRYAFSTILDSAATTIVEQVADAVEANVKAHVVKEGYSMKWRYSPGYGQWNLTEQPEMVRVTKAAEIGVHLTDSIMLWPRKSVTAIIGLYKKDLAPEMTDGEKQEKVPTADVKLVAPPEEPKPEVPCVRCNKTDCDARGI